MKTRAPRQGIVNSGRRFGHDRNAILDLVARLEPGLFVDAGAAAGLVTRELLTHSPQSRVVAYEPFPGNWPLFERTIGDDARVQLRRTALADVPGKEVLHVRSTVQGTEPGWEDLKGYSSLGFLAPAHRFNGRGEAITVPVARLDDEIHQRVRFLKIDIQGGEYRLLKGAEALIARHGIDVMFVEFNGDINVLRFLARRGYVIFDSVYEAWPLRRYWRNRLTGRMDHGPGWETVGTAPMSTGLTLRYVWPRIPLRGFRAYRAWLWYAGKFLSGIQTNLICIHRDVLAQVISSPPPGR